MFRAIRHMPFLKLVAILQLLLLARRHLSALTPDERRRMTDLVKHARRLTKSERRELRELALKLEPRAFAGAATRSLAPLRLPKRMVKGRG